MAIKNKLTSHRTENFWPPPPPKTTDEKSDSFVTFPHPWLTGQVLPGGIFARICRLLVSASPVAIFPLQTLNARLVRANCRNLGAEHDSGEDGEEDGLEEEENEQNSCGRGTEHGAQLPVVAHTPHELLENRKKIYLVIEFTFTYPNCPVERLTGKG